MTISHLTVRPKAVVPPAAGSAPIPRPTLAAAMTTLAGAGVAALTWLGTRGPALLALALVAGALSPEAASASEAALVPSVFLMSYGSLLAAALAPRETPDRPAVLAILILAAAVGPGVAMAALLPVTGVAPDLALGVLLAVSGPPVASAAALAAILGLPPRLALAVSIPPLLLCPFSAPVLMDAFAGTAVDSWRLAGVLAVVIGGAARATGLTLLVRRAFDVGPSSPLAASGVAVVGLFVVGVAAASRARLELEADFQDFGSLLLGAAFVTVALVALGGVLAAPLGGARAGVMGLVWGFRNQTLVWGALGASLPATAERFLVAMVLPILIAPLIARGWGIVASGLRNTNARRTPERSPVLRRRD